MVLLSAEGLSRDLGERILFDNISLGISQGDKIALVAPNGSGKSTLLKILAGVDAPDRGEVRPRQGVRIGYLSQEPEFDPVLTIQDVIDTANSEIQKVIREYQLATEDSAKGGDTQRLEEATAQMDRMGAWDYERRLKELLTRFKVNQYDQKIEELSGGQKKRLSIALVLLQNPDLLLLDEPTNHLDIDMIEWLEEYLQRSKMSLFMVTHDRYFLDTVCNQILELADKKLYVHRGNYAYYLTKKAEREQNSEVVLEKDRQRLKVELEWMRRSPKARTTKSRSRINAFEDLSDKVSGHRSGQEIKLDVKTTRIGGKVLEMMRVRKKFGDKVIMDGFDYVFKKGERVGIVGENGSGKSTFLDLITGKESIDGGKINVGDTIVMGYYTQEGMNFKPGQKVIDILREVADVITLSDGRKLSASQMLNRFLFPPEMQHQPVDKLSGGEKRRLHLLRILMLNPNFLILDEPTNDLDLDTLNRLEEFLEEYSGCLILVSHDRYFLDRLVDHLFIFEGQGEIRDFNGTYSEYRESSREQEQKMVVEATKKAEDTRVQNRERRLSYKEKLEYENLETEISELEERKRQLEEKLNSGTADYEELTKLSEEIGSLIEEIDRKTDRWMELDEIASN